jgi:hypothetical protein
MVEFKRNMMTKHRGKRVEVNNDFQQYIPEDKAQ